ncbi:MAG: acyl-CoA ligase (AMP-forming), exosortase A system-associated [Hahellaceae bacterium]|nr:acyl-CoA ligase (AMP-forming), exosortase A system-associated [Hahellaceae bacterium]
MYRFVHDLVYKSAKTYPDHTALVFKKSQLSYAELKKALEKFADLLQQLGLNKNDRVGIYLPKQLETVVAIFGTSLAGGVFVPINPLLKPHQVEYILNDCNVRFLVTSHQRHLQLAESLKRCPDLKACVSVDPIKQPMEMQSVYWSVDSAQMSDQTPLDTKRQHATDADLAAIFYTSGSTGNPKGVVLSHRNIFVGAESVSEYLCNTSNDKILALLPLSFDYGFSQLTTSFNVGACCIIMDYLLPQDVIKAVKLHQITGLAAVPPLWSQLVKLEWDEQAGASVRYFTNSGGAMPLATLQQLRKIFVNASPYLMYGLTEAFRSTYLPPDQVDKRPGSMGRAIPNAEIMVVREDGCECAPHEPGELVHRGPLVSLGYWNSPEKTEERFKPTPARIQAIPTTELAVWSGDTVYKDEEGFLYFVARKDDMIKSSGYRISPTEVEEAVYSSGRVIEAAAIGLPHPDIGQAVTIFATRKNVQEDDEIAVVNTCKKLLPNFMVPHKVIFLESLPHNPNGKINRRELLESYQTMFAS